MMNETIPVLSIVKNNKLFISIVIDPNTNKINEVFQNKNVSSEVEHEDFKKMLNGLKVVHGLKLSKPYNDFVKNHYHILKPENDVIAGQVVDYHLFCLDDDSSENVY